MCILDLLSLETANAIQILFCEDNVDISIALNLRKNIKYYEVLI